MKIIFETLKTSNENIYVDFGNGVWQSFPVNDAKTNGITIPDTCNDYSKIRIKGKAEILPNLDVITGIKQTVDPIYKDVHISQDDNGNYVVSIDENANEVFRINQYDELPFTIEKDKGNWYGFVPLKDNPNLLMGLYDSECTYLRLKGVELPVKEYEGGGKYLETNETTYSLGGSSDEYYVDLGSYQVGVTVNGSTATLDNVESLNDYSSADIILPDEIPELFRVKDNIYADNIDTYIGEVIENKPLYLEENNIWAFKATNILMSVARQYR